MRKHFFISYYNIVIVRYRLYNVYRNSYVVKLPCVIVVALPLDVEGSNTVVDCRSSVSFVPDSKTNSFVLHDNNNNDILTTGIHIFLSSTELFPKLPLKLKYKQVKDKLQ